MPEDPLAPADTPEPTAMSVEELAKLIKAAVGEVLVEGADVQPAVPDVIPAGAGLTGLIAAEVAKAIKNKAVRRTDIGREVENDPNKAMTSSVEPKAEEFIKRGAYPAGKDDIKLATGMFLKDLISAASPRGRTSEALKTWERFQRKIYLNETDDEQGAYLVPADIGAHIQAESLEGALAQANGARVYPLRGNRITITADVDETHATSFFGGVTIYRTAEAETKHESKQTFRQIELTLHKLTGVCRVTDELLEDSALALEADISSKFGQAIQFVKDDDFINGTGAGQALGILTALAPGGPTITVAAQPLQPAATIVYENIINMWARLYPQARAPIWMTNKTVFPQLASMGLAVGAGGGPVWLPAGGVSGAPYQTLMGLPLVYTEKCPALGTLGDIVLADWSQYAIAEKAGGIQTAASMHLYFLYDQQVFRFVLRYDGQPTWRVPLTPHNGATVSPFVVLAARP